MDSFDLVVIATLESEPTAPDETRLPRAKFRVVHYLRGKDLFPDTTGEGQVFESVVVSNKHQIGEQFLVMGSGTRTINWTTPMKVSDRVIDYLKHLEILPEKGPDRLAFFAEHFEDDEPVLANDAYDEFAGASYAEVLELGPRLSRDKLIGWLNDPDVIKPRKRLYYTLLGVCGTEKEIPYLEEIIRSGDRDRQSGLDALIACYLTLRGDEGVALVEETFLTNPKAEYIDVFSAITALRFHGTESDKVSRERIVSALRHVLDRPKMADMVIPDLARWEDWSVVDRLVQMFRDANTDDTKWVRTPIISYLQACPLPAAAEHIIALREIDPEAVQRAEMLADIDWADDESDDESGEGSGEATDKSAGQENDAKMDDPESRDSKDDKADENSDKKAGANGGLETADSAFPAASGRIAEMTASPTDGSIFVMKPVRNDDLSSKTSAGGQPATVGPDFEVNPGANHYVSTFKVGHVPGNDLSELGPEQLAQSVQPGPPVATIPPSSPSISIMLITVVFSCVLLFGLLWSVLSGRFERLIF